MKVGNRFALASFVLAVSAGSALAADHQMKVNEVMLSQGGSTANQFIELEDPGEPFPSGPYGLQVFDSAGVGSTIQNLNVQPNTTRITLATAGARTALSLGAPGSNGSTYIADLTLALPAAGTACFTRGLGTDRFLINCLSWGSAASVPTGPGLTVLMGPAPGDGMSLQRKASNCASVATPTPNAVNNSPVCVTQPPDAGVDSGTPVDANDTPDAGNNNNGGSSKDEGCSVGSGGGWFSLVGLAGVLFGVRGLRRRKRR